MGESQNKDKCLPGSNEFISKRKLTTYYRKLDHPSLLELSCFHAFQTLPSAWPKWPLTSPTKQNGSSKSLWCIHLSCACTAAIYCVILKDNVSTSKRCHKHSHTHTHQCIYTYKETLTWMHRLRCLPLASEPNMCLLAYCQMHAWKVENINHILYILQ